MEGLARYIGNGKFSSGAYHDNLEFMFRAANLPKLVNGGQFLAIE